MKEPAVLNTELMFVFKQSDLKFQNKFLNDEIGKQ